MNSLKATISCWTSSHGETIILRILFYVGEEPIGPDQLIIDR